MCVCVPSTFYERPWVVTSSSSSNNTRTYTCMSQRKLPHHKRWVTASFDALSQKRNPKEQNRQKQSFFQPLFFTFTPQQQQKKTPSSFVCCKNTSSSLFIIVVIIPTRSLFSPCVGEKVLLPLGPALFNYQPHETTRFVRSSSRNANRVSILDFGNTLITNHHRKLEIFIRRRHAFTFARRRGGERGRRDRGTRRRRDRRK